MSPQTRNLPHNPLLFFSLVSLLSQESTALLMVSSSLLPVFPSSSMGLFQVCLGSFRAFHFPCQRVHFADSFCSRLIFPHYTKPFPAVRDQPLLMKCPFRNCIQQRFSTRELLQVGEKQPGSPSYGVRSGTGSVLLHYRVWMILCAQFRLCGLSAPHAVGPDPTNRYTAVWTRGTSTAKILSSVPQGGEELAIKLQFGWSWEDLKQS